MASTSPVPASVVLSFDSASVALGKTVSFTAAVYDSSNRKLRGVKLDWSLTSTVTGCSIDQNGVLTVAGGATVGTYANLVQAAVHANPSISDQAQVNIISTPFSGGVFVGSHDCTQGCTDSGELAIHATATAFKALVVNSDNTFQEFPGTIDKHGNLSAVVNSHGDKSSLTGGVTSTGISGTWTNSDNSNSGTWTASAATVTGAGPAVGTGSRPGKQGGSASLAVIFHDDFSLTGTAVHKDNGQLTGTAFSGTWDSDNVVFTLSGNSGSDSVTGGSGTYYPAAKTASGELLNNTTKVGTWKVMDLR
jgi:hypothetical protein